MVSDQVETVARVRKEFQQPQEAEYMVAQPPETRLNSVAVCHVHKDKLDRVNRTKLAEHFISYKESRKTTFGSSK